jgi:hypothetical protein
MPQFIPHGAIGKTFFKDSIIFHLISVNQKIIAIFVRIEEILISIYPLTPFNSQPEVNRNKTERTKNNIQHPLKQFKTCFLSPSQPLSHPKQE